jgi:hypothetical protein
MAGCGWGRVRGSDDTIPYADGRCSYSEGMMKLRTVVGSVIGLIRDEYETEKMQGGAMDEKPTGLLSAFNRTFSSGEFVLLKRRTASHESATTGVTITASADSVVLDGDGYGYQVVAGGFNSQSRRTTYTDNWGGNRRKYDQSDFDQQYSSGQNRNPPNMLHAMIRREQSINSLMTPDEAYAYTRGLIEVATQPNPTTDAETWHIQTNGDYFIVELEGDRGQTGPIRIQRSADEIEIFYDDATAVTISFDHASASYHADASSPLTGVVQYPMSGVVVLGCDLEVVNVSNNTVTCTNGNGTFTIDHLLGNTPLKVTAWKPGIPIKGVWFNPTNARQHANASEIPHASKQFIECRSSALYKACCNINGNNSGMAQELVVEYLARQPSAPSKMYTKNQNRTYTLKPIKQKDAFNKKFLASLLLTFGAKVAPAFGWCVGGPLCQKVDALEAIVAWSEHRTKHNAADAYAPTACSRMTSLSAVDQVVNLLGSV